MKSQVYGTQPVKSLKIDRVAGDELGQDKRTGLPQNPGANMVFAKSIASGVAMRSEY